LLLGCGLAARFETPRNPDVYHIGEHGWAGDSIYFRVYQTSEPAAHPSLPKIEIECRSCNLVAAPTEVQFDAVGYTRIFFPEVRNLLSARIRVHGKGIDTTFVQKQRLPEAAAAYYHLAQPLVGRILVTQLAMLYSDTTQDSVLTSAQMADEINIFGEWKKFYLIHHPLFPGPVYLLKNNAVRLN
jgi:hypothetical protein